MSGISPIGKYSDAVAAITALIIVVAAVLAHLGVVVVSDTNWLDATSGIAIGVILGQRWSTNGAGKLASAANVRLDAIGAPPAAVIVPTPGPTGPVGPQGPVGPPGPAA